MKPYWSDDLVTLYHGDCVDVLAGLDSASVDAIVTDPPYALEFMGREWDSFKPAKARMRTRIDQRTNPTDGKSVTTTPESYTAGQPFQSWCEQWAAECLRVLKPGGHLLAFGGTRTYHRLACAIEDAGFEIRDSLHWIYGSGFPKSLDVSKAIDRAAGAEREVVGTSPDSSDRSASSWQADDGRPHGMVGRAEGPRLITTPATDDAKQWAGWGTALKPAHEPIVLARKPLAGTVAQNVLEHGTGGLNVDGCRTGTSKAVPASPRRAPQGPALGDLGNDPGTGTGWDPNVGRWPSNVLLGHSEGCVPVGTRKVKASTVVNRNNRGDRPKTASVWSTFADQRTDDQTFGDADGLETVEAWDCAPDCPVAEVDRQSGVTISTGGKGIASQRVADGGVYGNYNRSTLGRNAGGLGDTGGASRFFPVFRYQAKAGQVERPRTTDDASHPTVKPVALMGWLVRLVTPPGGIVLDPFAGSGTTAEACILEKIRCMLIEKDESSVRLCRERLRKPMQQGLFTLGELEGRS